MCDIRDITSLIKKYHVREIRILPMDKKWEFTGRAQVVDFFEAELPVDGKYLYQKRGIAVRDPHALVLFQYDNEVVAYAVLNRSVPFKKIGNRPHTEIVNGRRVRYFGYYKFFTDSIRTVQGIAPWELKRAAEGFSGFSQAKQFIDFANIKEICKLLYRKRRALEKNRP